MADANENRSHPALEQGIRRRMSQQSDDVTVQKKIEYYIASATMPNDEKQELSDDSIYQSVSEKLQNGDALSLADESQLQQNSIKAYERAKSLEHENEKFLEKLRSCKTQEEVRRTEDSYLESIISAYRLVENSGEIPIGQKLEHTLFKDAKISALQNVAQKFRESDAYTNLPVGAAPASPIEAEAPAAEDAAAENAEALKEWEARMKKAQNSYESLRQSIDEQEALESEGKVPFDAKG
ncbi:hypothetical protein D3Z38_06205 [Clostridiales bacterium]|nr:hypothetical protein [Clostridiales bacterium]